MKRWIQDNGRMIGLSLSTLLALVSYALPAGLFARWTATALLLAAGPLLVNQARPLIRDCDFGNLRGLGDRFLNLLPYFLTVIGCLYVLWPIPAGQMPVSQDHANHYFSTHILVNDLIPTGRIFGWTDRLSTGYPFGDIYATSCYLVTAFFHLVSFGSISLPTSYALGLVFVWLIPALAIVAWTKRIAGSGGAVLASYAFLCDVGSDREAGWVYSMFHGVWPQFLGVGIWIFALLALWRLTEKATTRRLAQSALLVGVALFAHPMNSITLLVAVVLMFSIRLLMRDRDGQPGTQRGAIRLIPAAMIGGFIGLAWVVRMVMTGNLLHTFPAYWKPISLLMGQLFDGGIFDYEVALVPVLAVVGVIRTVRNGGRFGAFAVLLPAVLLIIGSMDVVMNADLGLLGSKFGVMQYRRFSIPVKPLWYALAGVGLSTIARGMMAWGTEKGAAIGSLSGRLIFAVFLAPFVWGLVQASPGFIKSPAMRPLTMDRTGDRENVEAIGRLLEQEKNRCQSTYCRAVYWEKKGVGGLYPLVALADSDYGFLPTAKLPANNFRWINYTQSIDTMSRLGATVLITRWPQEHPLLEQLGTYGYHTVYRIKRQSDGRVEVIGDGTATVSSWEDERRTVELSGATPSTRLIVLMPPYRKWQAFQHGKPLGLAERREVGLVLSEVIGAKNGQITLEYHNSFVENLFGVIGGILGLGCLVGLFWPAVELPRVKNAERRAVVYRILSFALLGLVLALVCSVAISDHLAVAHEWLDGEPPGRRVLSVLHRSGRERVTFHPDLYCVRPYTRDPAPGCTEHDLAPKVTAGHRRKGKIPSCLSVGIPPSGETRISYTVPEGTERIKGRIHQMGRQGFTGEVVLVGKGQDIQKTSISSRPRQGLSFEMNTNPGTLEVTLILRDKNSAKACVELVALGR